MDLLNVYARLTGMQLQVSGQSLGDDVLDIGSLKGEILRRVEELEEREREREAELAEIRAFAQEVGLTLPPALTS